MHCTQVSLAKKKTHMEAYGDDFIDIVKETAGKFVAHQSTRFGIELLATYLESKLLALV